MATGCSNRTAPRRATLLALAFLLVAPTSGFGQSTFKTNRRWIFSLGLGLGLGVPAYLLTNDNTFKSGCSTRECIGITSGLVGVAIGYLVGAELDSRYERRMAAGPSLEYNFQDVPLDLVPDHISAFPGGAAVVGVGGARIIFPDGQVHAHGSGVRGIEDVAVMPQQNLLVLSTFANLISFPVGSDTAQGQVIDERGGGSMEVFQENLAVAGFDSLRLLSVSSRTGSVAAQRLEATENLAFVTDMAFSEFGRVGWILMEDRLAAYTADLEEIGEITLPAAGRTIRASGSRLAVAAGSNGVLVLDASDPSTPRVVQQYEGVRFAYAADLAGDRLYVAAGSEGVAVVDVSQSEPRVIGVARNSEFATDVVVARDGRVWIVDRDGKSIHIAEFTVGDE